MRPKITVLMPVYNAEKFVAEATESILEQTFKDFEFLIINDGSTDRSLSLIESFKDPRIRIVSNGRNRGVIFSLNRGLRLAKGEYIARMDADDISVKDRLEKQLTFLDAHPAIGICGSWTRIFVDGPGRIFYDKILELPQDSNTIKATMLFENVLQHPSVMIRQVVLKRSRLKYSTKYPHVEDYGLWAEMSRITNFAILPSVLLNYRLHAKQIGQLYGQVQLESAGKVHVEQIQSLGIKPTKEERQLHEQIAYGRYIPNRDFVYSVENWLLKIKKVNERRKIYDQRALSVVLGKRWFAACWSCITLSSWIWWKFSLSPLSDVTSEQKFRLLLATVVFPILSPLIKLITYHVAGFRHLGKKLLLGKSLNEK